MAQCYCLGCLECRIFIDLQNFLPTEAWYDRFDEPCFDFDLFPGNTSYCVFALPSSQFAQELATYSLRSAPDYVQKLVPHLLQFIEIHRGHHLFLISDIGDRPWEFPTDGWWSWKEKPVAFDFHTYLPRHLVEDLGLTDWPSAVHWLQAHSPACGNLPLEAPTGDALEFKRGFEQAVAMQRK